MVNSKGKLLKLDLTLTRLSVQSSPQLLLKLSSKLLAARCTGKQVLRFIISFIYQKYYLCTCCIVSVMQCNVVYANKAISNTW